MNLCSLSYENRLKHLKIDSLDKRRKFVCLKTYFKICNKFSDISVKWMNKIDVYTTPRHGIKTRTKFFSKLKLYDKSFFKYCSDLFNELPLYTRKFMNFNKFCKLLNEFYT